MSIIYTSTIDMSHDDWLRFRLQGLGASEIGSIFGFNEYQSSIELFHKKSNMDIDRSADNMRKFMGHFMEDKITEMWEHFGGCELEMINNIRSKNRLRKAQRINAYTVNERWPWLFSSVDRRINKHNGKGNGALELKTMSGYVSKKYTSGIPPQHMMQLQQQCLINEYEYGELAVLEDGYKLTVTPFEFEKEIGEHIIDESHDFWKRVVRTRIINSKIYHAERNFNMRLVEDLKAELQEIEPQPDDSGSYLDFMNERFKNSDGSGKMATNIDIENARLLFEAKEKEKAAKMDIVKFEQRLKKTMGPSEILDLGKNGVVNWKNNTRGNRTFRLLYHG